MNLLYVSATTTATQDLGGAFSVERWLYAARMTLLGMVMIFAVLGFLWGILNVFKLVMLRKNAKPKAKPASLEKKAVVVPKAEPMHESSASDDKELIAVLTAAVAAYRSEENANGDVPSDFRVVSFRRVSNGRAWNAHR